MEYFSYNQKLIFFNKKYFIDFLANHSDVNESFPVFYRHPSPKYTSVFLTFNYTCKASLPGQPNQTKDNDIKYQWRKIGYVSLATIILIPKKMFTVL